MKMQELIHLHGLLAQVQNHYEEQKGENVVHDRYEALEVQPTSIHKSKTDHQEAVFALAGAITDEMTQNWYEQVLEAAADHGEIEGENCYVSSEKVGLSDQKLEHLEDYYDAVRVQRFDEYKLSVTAQEVENFNGDALAVQ